MGKSPGRWIKSVLFGKKSSRSSTLKGREKYANENEVLVSAKAKASEVDVTSVPPVISHPTLITNYKAERTLELESRETTNLPHDGGILLPGNQGTNSQGSIPQDTSTDLERLREEKAATMAQAAFRGYLARRAFWALKGIIRLQALIRGHLVRRQAVATFCSVLGIVKLQAFVRGRKVRNSDIGQEVQKKCILVKYQDGRLVDSNVLSISVRVAKLSVNAFVRKLLAPSPSVMPLRLYYDPLEPNSISNWVERWSESKFWKPAPQPKKIASKTQRKQGNAQMGEAETGRPKRSVRRVPAANIDNTSVHATSELEKPKRNLRKVSSHPADAAQENPQNELEKVKRNLRKVHNNVVENIAQSEVVEIEKPKQIMEKVSGASGDNVLVQSLNNAGDKKKEAFLTALKQPDVVKCEPTLLSSKLLDAETTPETLEKNEVLELAHDEAMVESKPLVENGDKDENTPITNRESNHNDDPQSNENNKSGQKASTAGKQERAENGLQSTPTLPSYMAATESAKAKLRLQGSPRISQDSGEKSNASTRRHSLPSSINSKTSSQSPRTQRAIHGSGKGGNKSDKSSKDAKPQAEWRR